MLKSKGRPIINRGNGRCSFEEFLEKHQPDIEVAQHKLTETRGYSGSRAEEDSDYRLQLYDFLAWDVRAKMYSPKTMFEFLGFVWLCAPDRRDVNLMRAAEQLWEMYESHSG